MESGVACSRTPGSGGYPTSGATPHRPQFDHVLHVLKADPARDRSGAVDLAQVVSRRR